MPQHTIGEQAQRQDWCGDLPIKDANIGGNRHLIIDVACTHEFGGNHFTDVGRNGQLRDPDVNKLLETTACTKAAWYREAYANLLGTTYALLSTSGQIGDSCASFTSLPTGAPCGHLTTWGCRAWH
jgi:hypothetical protein